MKGQILINYRREDSLGSTGRLYDRFIEHFSREQVFMDVDAIEPGVDFIEVIEQAVASCEVFIAVIGPHWISVTDKKGQRRLENPEDFVRLEIVSALERNIRVIPVLVEGAKMPKASDLPIPLKPLARRNAIEISHARFDIDANRLIQAIERTFDQIERAKIAKEAAKRKKEEEKQIKIETAIKEAKSAAKRDDWKTARKNYREILSLQPDHKIAQIGLRKAQHKQMVADLYGQALLYQDTGEHEKTLSTLKRLQGLDESYEDVEERIKNIEASRKEKGVRQGEKVFKSFGNQQTINLWNKTVKTFQKAPRWAIISGISILAILLVFVILLVNNDFFQSPDRVGTEEAKIISSPIRTVITITTIAQSSPAFTPTDTPTVKTVTPTQPLQTNDQAITPYTTFVPENIYMNDPEWSSVNIGFDTKETIGEWGSLLTSLTMLVNGYGYSETPLTLNQKLKDNDGFQGALLIPSALEAIYPKFKYLGYEPYEDIAAPIQEIDVFLAQGHPVLTQVDWSSKALLQTHWVLLYDKQNNDYLMLDPYQESGDYPGKELYLTDRYNHLGIYPAQAITGVIWFEHEQ